MSAGTPPLLERGRTESVGGASIDYVVSTPDPSRGALVFIHGWGCNRSFWSHPLEALGRDFRCLAMDLAGHGASSAGDRVFRIEEFAQDVLAAVDATGLAEFIAIGHSMGGAVAVEVARLADARVRAVVAVDALTYPTVYPRIPEARVAAVVRAYRDDFRAAVHATMEPVFLPETDPALKAEILDALAATPREPGIAAIAGLLRWDGRVAIAACPAPIYCLCAEAFLDRGVVADYTEGVVIETIAGVGHFLMLEEPERFNDALRGLLRRID